MTRDRYPVFHPYHHQPFEGFEWLLILAGLLLITGGAGLIMVST